MNKIEEELKEGIGKYKKLFGYAFLIALLCYVFYIFYFIFNPKKDLNYESKVMAEIKSTDLIFDKKIIEKIKSKDITGGEIPTVKVERNPFQTY